MNIKFKHFFKPLFITALLLSSCQGDDLEDSSLDQNSFSEFKISRAGGDRIYNLTIGSDETRASDLIITNKITETENIESIFVISEAVTLNEVVVENSDPIEVIRHQIITTFTDIEGVRNFNFDMGTRTTYRIWNIRNRGNLTGLPGSNSTNDTAFLVENIDGDDFAITSLGEAVTVNLIPFIEDNVQSVVPTEPIGDNIPEGQPEAPSTGFTFTFDEDADFTFGMGNNSSTFSNDESTIVAEVTAGAVPSEPSDSALRVDLTAVNTSGGFYFAGTIFDITDLNLPAVDFTGSNKTIIANVYSTNPLGFRVQVSNAEGEAGDRTNVASPTPGFKQASHSGSGWEQITIDFNDGVNTVFGLDGILGGQPQMEPLDGVYNRIQLQFEDLPRGVESTIFVDNINYVGTSN